MFIAEAVFLWEYLLDFFQTGGFYNPSGIEITGFVFIGLFMVYISFRRKALRFSVVENELIKLFKEVSEAYEFKPVVFDRDVIVLESKPLPRTCRGQRITIVFDRNRVLLNSITRPEEMGDRNITKYWHNKFNLEVFRDEIADREREYIEMNKAGFH